MPARDPLEASRRSLQARALLKADGTLTGPSLTEGGVEVMRGDRVIATATSYEGPQPGTPGTVEGGDTRTEEHTSEIQALRRSAYADVRGKKKKKKESKEG